MGRDGTETRNIPFRFCGHPRSLRLSQIISIHVDPLGHQVEMSSTGTFEAPRILWVSSFLSLLSFIESIVRKQKRNHASVLFAVDSKVLIQGPNMHLIAGVGHRHETGVRERCREVSVFLQHREYDRVCCRKIKLRLENTSLNHCCELIRPVRRPSFEKKERLGKYRVAGEEGIRDLLQLLHAPLVMTVPSVEEPDDGTRINDDLSHHRPQGSRCWSRDLPGLR